jgi:negative regulator of sigma E activity
MAFSFLVGVGVAFGAEPKEWLERMNHALTTRNYIGVFTHNHAGRVETLRIIHRVRGAKATS